MSDTGAAYVFRRTTSGWQHEATLVAGDGSEGDQFGFSVALSDGTALVGAPGADGLDADAAGAVYAFARRDGGWRQTATLTLDERRVRDRFGASVAASGDTAVVGAKLDDTPAGVNAGSAVVYQRTAEGWNREATLRPSDADFADFFGSQVAIEGSTILVNAPGDSERSGVGRGAVYVFERREGGWDERAKLAPDDEFEWEEFGATLALGAETAVIGAPNDGEDSNLSAGSAWVYERTSDGWTLASTIAASDRDRTDLFSSSLAVHDGTIIAGAMGEEDPNGHNAGAAYRFDNTGGEWHQQAKLTPPEATSGALFGGAAAMTSDAILVGADKATVDGVPTGAAYVFEH